MLQYFKPEIRTLLLVALTAIVLSVVGILMLKNFSTKGTPNENSIQGNQTRFFDGDFYASDGQHVYYGNGYAYGHGTPNIVIPGADPNTFTSICGLYGKDVTHVYYYGEPIPEADPSTFTFICDGSNVYGKDATHVYYLGQPIPGADPNTFTRFGYSKSATHVYYYGRPILGADPNTFAPICGEYSKDATHVYYDVELISGADLATFVVVDEKGEPCGDGDFLYAKDAAHVYTNEQLVQDADPQTFTVLKGGFTKDARHVYLGDTILANADAQSFVVIAVQEGSKNTIVYAKDATHVFYFDYWQNPYPAPHLSIIPDADPATFVLIGGYSKDAHAVYWGDGIVSGADQNTFQSVDYNYGKDSHFVYYGDTRIIGADPNTFVVLGLYVEYSRGGGYAKDAHAVYFYGEQIPGADPATFEAASESEMRSPNYIDTKDKNHGYYGGQIVY